MSKQIQRRQFLSVAATGAVGAAVGGSAARRAAAQAVQPVRIGVIGTGGRGTGLLGILLGLEGVEVPAVCDISVGAARQAQDLVERSGRPRPRAYTRDETVYRRLVERDDLDAVLIATYWQWHAPMAVEALRCGKYVAVEVPAAINVQQCWDLVNASEESGMPCMMLENWSFRRDNLAVLNMIRAGLLGEMVHCHCAHSHDCIDHWFFDGQGNDRWPAWFLINRNCDQYPTHSLGPVLSWLDINVGDAFATLTSTATDSRAINAYFARQFGPDHPGAKRRYQQGDIVTSVVRTHQGKSIVINFDMQLPRPYDNRWMVQGTLGIYDEDRAVVYLTDRSPRYHEWEPFAPYQEEFDHTWCRAPAAGGTGGHGGTDDLELALFVEAVRNRTQTPIDVYDSATMSCVVGLSEESIAQGGAPVECPDFTRGAWQTRRPTFGVVG